MEKKSFLMLVIELLVIFVWLLVIGQGSGQSGFSGDINVIDEGQFAAWVGHMIQGKIAYKDIYIQYGPGLIFPIYFLMKLFGQSIFFVRLVISVIYVFLGICVVEYVLSLLNVHKLLRILTIVFILIIPGISIRHWLGVFFLVLLIQAFDKKSLSLAFVSGIILALTLLESIEVGLYAVVITIPLFGFYLLKSKEKMMQCKLLLITFIGISIPLIIFSLIAWSQGWLLAYIHQTRDISTSVSGINLPNGQGLPDPITGHISSLSPIHLLGILFSKVMLFYWSLLLLLLFISLSIIELLSQKINTKILIVSSISMFALMTYASIVGRSGHYFMMVPFIFVIGSFYVSKIYPFKMQTISWGTKFLGLAFTTLFIMYGLRHISIFRYDIFTNLQDHNASISRITPLSISSNQAKDIVSLQKYFYDNSQTTDQIYLLNNIPAFYFLLNRENATMYDLPLLAGSKQKRLEIVAALERNKPKYIIEDTKAWAVDDISDKKRMPEVFDYVKGHYIFAHKVEHYIIYKRA